MILETYLSGGRFDPKIADLPLPEVERVLSTAKSALTVLGDDTRLRKVEEEIGLTRSRTLPWLERGISGAFQSLGDFERSLAIITAQSLLRKERRNFALGIPPSLLQAWFRGIAEGNGSPQMPPFDVAKGAALLFDPSITRLPPGSLRDAAGVLIRRGLHACLGRPEFPQSLQAKLAAVLAHLSREPDHDTDEPDEAGHPELVAAGLGVASVMALREAIGSGTGTEWVGPALQTPVDIERLWRSKHFRSAAESLGFRDLDPAIFDPDPSPIVDPWVQLLREMCATADPSVSGAARNALHRIPREDRRSRAHALNALGSIKCCVADRVRDIVRRECADQVSTGVSRPRPTELASFGLELFAVMLADRLSLSESAFEERSTCMVGPTLQKWFSRACRAYMKSVGQVIETPIPVEGLKGLRPESMSGVPEWIGLSERAKEWIARARDMEMAGDAAKAGREWLITLVQRCANLKPHEYDGGRGVLLDKDHAVITDFVRARAAQHPEPWYRRQLPLHCEMRLLEAFARTTGQMPAGLAPLAEAVATELLKEVPSEQLPEATERVRSCIDVVVNERPGVPTGLVTAFRRGNLKDFMERLGGADVELPVEADADSSTGRMRVVALSAIGLLACILLFEPVACRRSPSALPPSGSAKRTVSPSDLSWKWLPQSRVWAVSIDDSTLRQLFGARTLALYGSVLGSDGMVSASLAQEAVHRYRLWSMGQGRSGVPDGPYSSPAVVPWSDGVDVRLPAEGEAREAVELSLRGPLWTSAGTLVPAQQAASDAGRICVVIDATR